MNKGKITKPLVTHRLALALLALVVTLSITLVMVTAQNPGEDPLYKGLIACGVGLAIGLAGLGAGLGMGSAGAAAVGAISERPEVFGKAMIFIVFIEAIAIYGLLIAFMLLGKIA
jgi:V/A-type H+-transporting ATPase subunit K